MACSCTRWSSVHTHRHPYAHSRTYTHIFTPLVPQTQSHCHKHEGVCILNTHFHTRANSHSYSPTCMQSHTPHTLSPPHLPPLSHSHNLTQSHISLAHSHLPCTLSHTSLAHSLTSLARPLTSLAHSLTHVQSISQPHTPPPRRRPAQKMAPAPQPARPLPPSSGGNP